MDTSVKAVFIPYAGASSFAYYKWRSAFEDMQPVFVELAGRGMRSGEPFYESIEAAAEDVARLIEKNTRDSEYCIFGHSMGSLIAFETYYKLMQKKAGLPMHMFFSGREPPQVKRNRIHVSNYNDDEFLQIVASYGGLPKEFYHEDIRSAFLPILRADFGNLCEYEYRKKSAKIECDITVLYGKKELGFTTEEIARWREHADGRIEFRAFDGDHFFIHEYFSEIVRMMEESVFPAQLKIAG